MGSELATTVEEADITAVAPAPAAPGLTLFGTADPLEVIEKATALAEPLAKLIEDRNLYKEIRDRRHVFVEGWTLLGSMLGVFPQTVWTRKVAAFDGEWREPTFTTETRTRRDGGEYEVRVVDKPGKGGWEARVEARTLAGHLVGSAETECRWSEELWKDRDSHALRSMAATRGTSKALKLPLGFVMELAGYSPTPADEMDGHAVEVERNERTTLTTEYQCPHCGAAVNDHREDHANNPKFPPWKCSSSKCDGGDKKRDGDGRWGWSSYEVDEFEEPFLPRLIDLTMQRVTDGDRKRAEELVQEAAKALEVEWSDLDSMNDTAAKELATELFAVVKNLAGDTTEEVSDEG